MARDKLVFYPHPSQRVRHRPCGATRAQNKCTIKYFSFQRLLERRCIGIMPYQSPLLHRDAVHGPDGRSHLVNGIELRDDFLLVGHRDIETRQPFAQRPLLQSLHRGQLEERIAVVLQPQLCKLAGKIILRVGVPQPATNQSKFFHFSFLLFHFSFLLFHFSFLIFPFSFLIFH